MSRSRSFTIVDVPEPVGITTNFVYNFFVPNERVDSSGNKYVKGVKNKTLQKLVDISSLQLEVPRYVEVNFSQVETFGDQFGDAKNQATQNSFDISKANSEETITNVGFVSLRETDDDAIPRLKEKLDALSKVLGINFEDSDQSKKLATQMGVSRDHVQSIISPLNNESFLVNAKKTVVPVSVFQLAAENKIACQINKRLVGACVNSADDSSPLSKTEIIFNADKISKDFIATAQQMLLVDEDVEPIIEPTYFVKTQDEKTLLGISCVGYLLTRYRFGEDGKKKETKMFFLPGSENTKYLDTEVVYGATYSYSTRAVYQVDAVLNGNAQSLMDNGEDAEEKTNWRVTFLVTSRPSTTSRVRTEEFEPPNEPDGVFYNFNYDAGRGLVVRWQVPSGRSRDVKYFQVFRRRSIFEPFICIAQIDFDDSVVRTLLPERVRDDRIFAYPGARTFYEDTEFTRSSKFIYAVAAVDAHGITSGYSAQSEVGFNIFKNSLALKSISRGGAPKQYPNFYVDPDLDENITVDSFTQDAIFDSGHKKMSIYFTPDARLAKTATGDEEKVFYTDNEQGTYPIHIINLDLQKADTATINIVDLLKKM
jgi:hypothetical protein